MNNTLSNVISTLGSMALGIAILLSSCGKSHAPIYSYTVTDNTGAQVSMSKYEGKVLLIVNTATRCGFTPQYEELEAMYKALSPKGLEILDFPCNQFGEQAPGSAEEIARFCTSTYGTEFPQFGKICVNGEDADPLFTYLKSQKGFEGFPGEMGEMMDRMLRGRDPEYDRNPDIKWNFTKFLVDRRGNVVARFEPTAPLKDVWKQVEAIL